MKRLNLRALLATLAIFPAVAMAQPYTTSVEQQRLIGLGVSPEVAREQMNFLNGGGIFAPVMPTYVATMAATPAAATNKILPGVNVVPTAAANTAALLPSTPVPGQVFLIVNGGPNAVRIKAGGSAAINGGSAGNYIPLATLQQARCITTGAAAHNCSVGTVPTPAGP